jgi:hypothetical protein
MKFDSRKEYYRWCELCQLERVGKITDLQRQVKFILIPTQYEPYTVNKNGTLKRGKMIERECSYLADFVYTEKGNRVVEDVKGFKTADYKIKRKLMLHVHGVRIKET